MYYYTEQNNYIFYRRAKPRQIFRGYFVPRTDTQTNFFPTCTLQREKGVIFFSRTENTVIIFHLLSIVKYDNINYVFQVLTCIRLNEDDTSSASRIFIKIMFQELSEFMGLPKLNERLKDP